MKKILNINATINTKCRYYNVSNFYNSVKENIQTVKKYSGETITAICALNNLTVNK